MCAWPGESMSCFRWSACVCALCAATKAAAAAAAVVGTKIAVCVWWNAIRRHYYTTWCISGRSVGLVGRSTFIQLHTTQHSTLARQMPAQCYNIKGLFVIGYLKGSGSGVMTFARRQGEAMTSGNGRHRPNRSRHFSHDFSMDTFASAWCVNMPGTFIQLPDVVSRFVRLFVCWSRNWNRYDKKKVLHYCLIQF